MLETQIFICLAIGVVFFMLGYWVARFRSNVGQHENWHYNSITGSYYRIEGEENDLIEVVPIFDELKNDFNYKVKKNKYEHKGEYNKTEAMAVALKASKRKIKKIKKGVDDQEKV